MNNHEVFRLCREHDSPGVDQYSVYTWILLIYNLVNINMIYNLNSRYKQIRQLWNIPLLRRPKDVSVVAGDMKQ